MEPRISRGFFYHYIFISSSLLWTFTDSILFDSRQLDGDIRFDGIRRKEKQAAVMIGFSILHIL